MRRLTSIALLIAVVTGSEVPAVQGSSAPMYVSDSANNVLSVDLSTGVVELAANVAAQLTDIAFSPAGDLYGITPAFLYEIDLGTSWSTLIGAHGFSDPAAGFGLDALTFDRDGTLYAAGDDILITIDPLTGAGTAVGPLSGYRSAGDLAIDGMGRLVLATDSGNLVEVQRDGTGATQIGSIPYDDVYALAANADGTLYGLRSTSEIVVFDQQTGRATVTGTLDADFLIGRPWGGSIPGQFIPEPATLLLLLSGGIALVLRRR
jgi:hypothetical protein